MLTFTLIRQYIPFLDIEKRRDRLDFVLRG